MTSPLPVPRLLVSVRDAREARAAAAGGADIIDFKNPARGPLGRADFDVVAEAALALREDERLPLTPLSAALGEVRDVCNWNDAADCSLPVDVAWLKLGLSGLGMATDWIDEWLQLRTVIEQRLQHPVRWVAVAYADADTADAPPVDEIVEAAAETACAGVLIDTFDKTGGRLLDLLDAAQLSRIGEMAHDRGLFFALAGRLRSNDLIHLRDVPADVIAVRSAVCDGEDRQADVSARRVTELRRQIHAIAETTARGIVGQGRS